MKNPNVAIFSPNKITYSETFIQVLKDLPFQIKYYYGGYLPGQLENSQSLLNFSLTEKINRKLSKRFSLGEYGLFYSLKREKIDCVIAEYGPTACKSLRVLKALKLPLIVHFHGFDASDHETIENYKNEYKWVFEYAKAIIVVSKKMFDQLVSMGCPFQKLYLIVCGARQKFFDIEFCFESNQFFALGRFVDKKAPYLTLASFKKALKVHPDAKLIMGGDGMLLNACMNLSKVWNIDKNVEFTGAINQTQVIKYLASSVAFVQHSMTALTGDAEGTPVAVIEAMAAGLPIIATSHAGIPDIVKNNQSGLLCEEMDVDGMANNMILVLENKSLAKRLGKNAKQYALNYLTIDIYLKKISDIINTILVNTD